MKKYEYLSELEKRLSALPADARRDALNYYEEYFDAAGPDNEDATAAELGDPAEAARKILEGEGLTPDADPAAPESARGGAVPRRQWARVPWCQWRVAVSGPPRRLATALRRGCLRERRRRGFAMRA